MMAQHSILFKYISKHWRLRNLPKLNWLKMVSSHFPNHHTIQTQTWIDTPYSLKQHFPNTFQPNERHKKVSSIAEYLYIMSFFSTLERLKKPMSINMKTKKQKKNHSENISSFYSIETNYISFALSSCHKTQANSISLKIQTSFAHLHWFER